MIKPYSVKEIWAFYAQKLLQENPEWWGSNNRNYSGIKPYYIYRYVIWNGKKVKREVMNYKRYREVVENFFKLAQDRIIKGEYFYLGRKMGNIAARRCERNPYKLQVNNRLTRELRKKDPTHPLVYYTDPDWCRIGWEKTSRENKLLQNYRFKPTCSKGKGQPAFKERFSSALDKDPVLKYRYKYFPIVAKSERT